MIFNKMLAISWHYQVTLNLKATIFELTCIHKIRAIFFSYKNKTWYDLDLKGHTFNKSFQTWQKNMTYF